MRIALKAGCAALLILGGFLAYAGYFDDDVLVDVPATARPAPAHSGLAAVYFSGDAGYRMGMGRMLGNRLAADGIPLVAINSMGFFRPHRSVAEVAKLIATAMTQALSSGHADQVVLIGHSLGADALQSGLVDLPPALRTKVRAVVLIVPTSELYLRVSPAEMLSLGAPDAEVLPTLRQLTWAPLTCIYGKQEPDSPCPQLEAPNMRVVALPGGHALDRDVTKIHSAILGAIDAAIPKV